MGVEGHTSSSPDQSDNALGHHGPIEYSAALFFAGDATGHHGRLGGMEARNGTAGHCDEHHGPLRRASGMQDVYKRQVS